VITTLALVIPSSISSSARSGTDGSGTALDIPISQFSPEVAAERHPQDGSLPLQALEKSLPILDTSGPEKVLEAKPLGGYAIHLRIGSTKLCVEVAATPEWGGSVCTSGRRGLLDGRFAVSDGAASSLQVLLLDSDVAVSSVPKFCTFELLLDDASHGVSLWGCTPPAPTTAEVDLTLEDGTTTRAQITGMIPTGS
jgi:hypothetical protein